MRIVTAATPERVEEAVSIAADVLAAGGVIAFPTDTLYGLAVDAANADAVERLYRVKERPASAALPLIAADLPQAERCARFDARARALARAFWPGPLSIVLPATEAVALNLRGPGNTVAIRVPDDGVARAIAARLGRAITATSANRSGEPAAVEASAVIASIGDRLDLVVDAGRARGGPPSTIVEVSGDAPRLVRAGAIAWERVLDFLA